MKSAGSLYLIFFLSLLVPLSARAQTLTINNDIQSYATLASTAVTMTGNSELRITGATSPITASVINLNSPDSWFFMTGIRPATVNSTYLPQVRVSGAVAVHGTNCRVVQYGDGTVVIPHSPTYSPMTIYTGEMYTGTAMALAPYTTYTTSNLGVFADNVSSFKLKRGYMATLAQGSAGTGVSRCYVAQDGDLDVSVIQSNLNDQVSFIRVFPWRWVNKKGIAGNLTSGLNVGWWYNWNLDQNSPLNEEYVAIRQTRWWPGLAQDWQARGVNHLLGYNEPDHVDQANLTVAEAISSWPDLLATGLRVGSPAVTDGGRSSWLYPFMTDAGTINYRVDFVAVHYYRCFNPSDAAGAATQMYNFLKEIHDTTGKPIWITEWNQGANWTGCGDPTSAQHSAAVSAMMDMLESTPWVERYSLYNWVEDVRRVKWDDGSLTASGVMYRDKVSGLSYWQDIPSSPLPATALYRFETNPNDNSGNGHIAVLKSGAKYGAGRTGQGVSLGGNGEYVQLSKRIGDSTDFTFGAWVKWNGGAAWQRIFDLGLDTSNTIFLTPSSSAGTVRFGIEVGNVQQLLNHTAALPLNTWTHVAVTISGNTGKLFINGALVATNTSMTHNPSSVGTEFNYLGKSQFGDPSFNGTLDDVTFLPYALADAKITTMMTNNPPVFSAQVITTAAGTQGVAYSSSIASQATDPDAGDTLAFSKLSGPSWLTVSSNGALSGTPPAEEEGLQEFVVAVTDGSGATATAVLNITLPSILGNGTWTANASGSWGLATNWTANFPANGAANTASFNTVNITADTTVTLDKARSIGYMVLGDTSGTQAWTLGSAGSTLTLVNGTTAPILRTNTATTVSLPLAGAYGMTKDGAAMLTLSGDNSITGPLNVDTNDGTSDDGVLRIANPDAVTGFTSIAIRNNNSGKSRLELDGTARDIVAAAPIALAARAPANVTAAIRNIAGNNVLSGTMTLGTGGASYIVESTAGQLTFDGNITSTSGGTRLLTFAGSGGFYIGGEIRDDTATTTVLALTKNGAGSMVLQDKDNTFSGPIILNGGTLTGISSVSFNFGNGAIKGPFGNPSAAGRTITVNSGGTLIFGTGNCFGGGGNTTVPTVAITINSGGVMKTAAAIATTPGSGGGDANLFGPITLAGGTFTTGNGYSPTYQAVVLMSTLTANGSNISTINSDATNTTANGMMLGKSGGGTVTFDVGSGGLDISVPLANSAVSGAGALTKTGVGTLTLNNANTYTGATTLSVGTIALFGSLTSPLTVATGAVLRGTGSNSGATNINGSHYPGNPAGAQTFTGNLAYGAASRLRWLLNANDANAASRVNSAAVTVTAGAVIDLAFNVGSTVNFTDIFWKEPRSWNVVTHTSRTGNFALGNASTDSGGLAVATYGAFSLQQTAAAVTLVFTPVLTPNEAWLQANFGANWSNPAIAGDTADPDADGQINVWEFFHGTNPNTTAQSPIVPQLLAARLAIVFPRTVNTGTLTVTAQAADVPAGPWTDLARSTDGAAFTAIAAGTPVTETGTGATRSVEIRDIYTTAERPVRCMRLHLQKP